MDENSLKDDSKADFVFNADESGFNSDLKKVRAIGVKGKPLNRVSGGSGKQSTTVLSCISTDGKALPPLFVFKEPQSKQGGLAKGLWKKRSTLLQRTAGWRSPSFSTGFKRDSSQM